MTRQQQTYPSPLAHVQLCSSSRDGVQALWWSLSERSFNGDKTSVSQQLTGFLSLSRRSLPCAFSVFTSWRLARSPARRAGVRGLYISGATYCGDSAASCVCVCVVVCQVLCACVGWSVVSLLAMRHSSRHTCTHRGGGCCVRGEGAVGDLCELDLGFLVFTSQSGCYSIVVRESRYTIDRWGGGSKVKASLWVIRSLFPPRACSVFFICFLVRWNKSFSLHYVTSITKVGGCSFSNFPPVLWVQGSRYTLCDEGPHCLWSKPLSLCCSKWLEPSAKCSRMNNLPIFSCI